MILGPHPLACILPPDMLERLILNGSQEQRQDALRTLARDNSLRSLRAQNLALRIGSFPPLPAHVGVDGVPNRTVFDCASTEDLRSARRVRAEGEEADRRRRRRRGLRRASAPPTGSSGTSTSATRSTTRACR